jgi:ketosteroid isomerase-like protein
MKQTIDSVHAPEMWPHAFTEHLEAGNLAEIVALYEPEARMLAPGSGEVVAGHAAIRSIVAGLIQARARMQCQVIKCVTTGDLAMLYTDFHGSMTAASGEKREIRQRAIEILRRQADGTWKLVFGDPLARGGG